MERFKAQRLTKTMHNLHDRHISFAMDRVNGGSPSEINEAEMAETNELLLQASSVSNELGLRTAVSKISHSIEFFADKFNNLSHATAETELRNVIEAMHDALAQYQFIKIAPGREKYIGVYLIGKTVDDKFPSAVNDIREAKACLMAGCDTAAVFHLMRVVEWGLRAFCVHLGFKKLKSKIKRTGKNEYKPVAYSEWEHILAAAEIKVDTKLNKTKRGTKKQEDQEFYLPVLQEVRAIRDAWRNHVMHTRAKYNASDADAITDHVRRLMQHLTKRVAEV